MRRDARLMWNGEHKLDMFQAGQNQPDATQQGAAADAARGEDAAAILVAKCARISLRSIEAARLSARPLGARQSSKHITRTHRYRER